MRDSDGIINVCAPIAQLDRASGYEPGGRTFESCWAHHFNWGTSSPKPPYSLSRSLLRHARSVREARSRRSLAVVADFVPQTPLLALPLAASPRSPRSRGSFAALTHFCNHGTSS